MADIQDNDLFLVNRNDSTATVPASELMAEILDDDLMLVNRNDVTYTVTGAEVKESLGGIQPVDPTPNEVTASPDFQGGTGTELDPYILAPITVAPAGSTGETVETITIAPAGATEGQPVLILNNSVGSGARFDQNNGAISAAGTLVGKFRYADIPDTTVDQDYVGDIQVGQTYFRWTVTQDVVSDTPPIIDSVTLTEQNPGAEPRFTNQKFDFAMTMADNGTPDSIKTIDAFVQGAITTQGQFDEPLESSISSGQPEWSTAGTFTATGQFNFTAGKNFSNSFDGSKTSAPGSGNTWNNGASSNGSYTYTLPNPIENVTSLKIWVRQIDLNHINYTARVNGTGGSISLSATETDLSSALAAQGNTLSSIQVTGSYYNINQSGNVAFFCALEVNGELLVDNGATGPGASTTLTFAAGTDMSTLETGDTVKQGSQSAAETWSNGLSSPNNLFAATLAFNGSENDGAYILTNYGKFNWNIGYDINGKTLKIKTGQNNKAYTLGFFSGGSEFARNVTSDASSYVEYNTNDLYVTDPITQIYIQANDAFEPTVNAFYLDNEVVIDGQPIAITTSGTVGSITDTAVTLSSSAGAWTDGVNVTGPQKTIVGDNVKKYLKFDNNGNVTDLLNSPQSPILAVSEENPTLTFTFPATFPSGNAPDDELGEGTTLTVTASASNSAGVVGPISDSVQPQGPGIIQFNEPLESHGQRQGPTWSAGTWTYGDLWQEGTSQENSFDGDYNTSYVSGRTLTISGQSASADLFLLESIKNVTEILWYADDYVGNFYNLQLRINQGPWNTIAPTTGDPASNVYRYDMSGLVNPNGSTELVSIGARLTDNGVASGQFPRWATVIKVNGKELIDDDPTWGDTTLTFAAGTDMTTLANGDRVDQGATNGTIGSITDTTVTLASSSGTWTDGVNVVGPDKTPFRSLTQEELDEQSLKFQTYDHRKHVECAAQAEAERDALIQSMVDQGYELDDILRYL